MRTIRDVLAVKGRKIWSVRPDETVFNAIKQMDERNVGSLLVIDGEKLLGILTERHYARNVILRGRTSPTTPVAEIMETNLTCVRPTQTVKEGMALMTASFVRHLPVVDDGDVVGVVSIGDLVKSIIEDQQFVIDQLEHYISR
ncbi:MAG: CBS domain-containing protein [Hyphomicrobiaceae bacterium]